MVTPFDRDGELDVGSARRLAARLIETGSHGVVVAGTTGEAPTLSDEEKLRLLEGVLDEVGDRALVIAGTGTNDTRHSVDLTARAAGAGAHAVLAVTPYYNKPNRDGLRAHYSAIAEAAGATPVVLYNIPSRSVINVAPDLLAELAAENPAIVAVKQANDEDLGSIEGLDLLAGNDDSFATALEAGAVGGVLVASHLAGPQMREIYDLFRAGDREGAAAINARLRPFYAAMAITSNPIPVKTALELSGVIDARMRLPMVPASDEQRRHIASALDELPGWAGKRTEVGG